MKQRLQTNIPFPKRYSKLVGLSWGSGFRTRRHCQDKRPYSLCSRTSTKILPSVTSFSVLMRSSLCSCIQGLWACSLDQSSLWGFTLAVKVPSEILVVGKISPNPPKPDPSTRTTWPWMSTRGQDWATSLLVCRVV